jgi:hypothetical protein
VWIMDGFAGVGFGAGCANESAANSSAMIHLLGFPS